jgi:putative DNA primase/helicase
MVKNITLNIPKEILKMENWVSTHNGKPNQSINNPLFNFHTRHHPGFVLTMQHNICGIDIDDCIIVDKESQQKLIDNKALHFIQKMNTYTEFSRSGKGIHMLFKADKNKIAKLLGENRKGVRKKVGNIGWEFYIAQRQLVITGNVPQYKDIRYIEHEELKEFLDFMIPPKKNISIKDKSIKMKDKKILDIISRSRQKNKFHDLWNREPLDGNSDGDFALAGILSFYTQDENQIIRILRASPCGQRKKFDRDNYLYPMVRRAIDNRTGTYKDRRSYYA